MTGTKASEALMDELHGALVDNLLTKVRNGDATPAELSTARQLLKDNGINTDAMQSDKMKSLSDDLPDDIDNVTPLYGG